MKPYGGFINDFDCGPSRKNGDKRARQQNKKAIKEQLPLFFRAAGNAICGNCGKIYLKHPLALEPQFLDNNDEPYLNRLCDGTLVKL